MTTARVGKGKVKKGPGSRIDRFLVRAFNPHHLKKLHTVLGAKILARSGEEFKTEPEIVSPTVIRQLNRLVKLTSVLGGYCLDSLAGRRWYIVFNDVNSSSGEHFVIDVLESFVGPNIQHQMIAKIRYVPKIQGGVECGWLVWVPVNEISDYLGELIAAIEK